MTLPFWNTTFLRSLQSDHMYDACKLLTPVVTKDTTGEEVVGSFTEGAEILCGFEMNPGSEYRNQTGTQLQWDAVVRLPSGTVLTAQQSIRITKRNGSTLSVAEDYEVVSPPQVGQTAVRVLVRKVLY